MNSRIDNVKKGERITAEAWNELVERVNALERRQAFNFTVPQKQKPVVTLALFAITWNWTNDANNVPYASASPVDTRTGAVGEETVTVFAPNGYGSGQGVLRRWCVWRGRWELCDKVPDLPNMIKSSFNLYTQITAQIDALGGLHFDLAYPTSINYYSY